MKTNLLFSSTFFALIIFFSSNVFADDLLTLTCLPAYDNENDLGHYAIGGNNQKIYYNLSATSRTAIVKLDSLELKSFFPVDNSENTLNFSNENCKVQINNTQNFVCRNNDVTISFLYKENSAQDELLYQVTIDDKRYQAKKILYCSTLSLTHIFSYDFRI